MPPCYGNRLGGGREGTYLRSAFTHKASLETFVQHARERSARRSSYERSRVLMQSNLTVESIVTYKSDTVREQGYSIWCIQDHYAMIQDLFDPISH